MPPRRIGPARIVDVVGVVGADVGPERVGMADEARLRVRLQNRLEPLEPGREHALALEVRHLLEVHHDRDAELAGERIEATQLGTVGLDM